MFDFTRIAMAVLVAAAACWTSGASAATAETYGPTGPNDTLWSIANQMRPAGATVEQTMLALTRINPDAFVGRQGNLVVAGAQLRAPTLAEAQAVTAARALQIVADPDVHWAEVLGMPANVENQDVVPLADAEDERIAPPAVTSMAAERTADESTLAWQTRAEDAELRVGELEQERDALQAELDEQAATVASAEQRVSQLEAQLIRRPRGSVSFLGRDAPSPTVLWGALGTAVIVVFLIGFVFGRRRGAARAFARGAGPKAQLGPRAVSSAAITAVAEAPRTDSTPSAVATEPIQLGQAPAPRRDPPAAPSPPASDVGGGMTYAAFSAGRLREKAAMVGADQGGVADAAAQTAPVGTDMGGAGVVEQPLGGASDEGRITDHDWRDRPIEVEPADADFKTLGAEGDTEDSSVAGDAQAPWMDLGTPHVADEPSSRGPQPVSDHDPTFGGAMAPDWRAAPGGAEATGTYQEVPGTVPDDEGFADLDPTGAPKANYSVATKLNLARAYADLSDHENARAMCLEVMQEGNDAEREAARALLERLNEPRD